MSFASPTSKLQFTDLTKSAHVKVFPLTAPNLLAVTAIHEMQLLKEAVVSLLKISICFKISQSK